MTEPTEVTVVGATDREDADPYCLADEEADRLLRGAPWRRFVVMGDSLAEGVGDALPGYRDRAWPDRTADALRRQQPDLETTNLGLRFLTAAQVRESQLDRALAQQPDLVALVCGGNDLLGERFDLDGVAGDFAAMVDALRAAGADVVTYCLQDIAKAFPDLRPIQPRIEALNGRVRDISRRAGAIVVDMWEHPVCGDREVYSKDMIHSSAKGHAVLAAETLRALGARLAGRAER